MKNAEILNLGIDEKELNLQRPIPFWSWNDRLEEQELRRQIREMKEMGMGGFFMHARGGLETEYMSDEWFRAVENSADEAKKTDMQAWCYDENGWPSGFAGGELLKDPENLVHYLTYEKKTEFDEKALGVYILDGDVLSRVSGAADGAAEYHCVYDNVNTSAVDILNPAVTDRFIKLTHEKYAERFGERFSRDFAGFFTDEPQYFRTKTGYSPVIHEEYRKKYGRDLLSELGALFVDCSQAYGVRFRYWKLMNELYTENFIGRIYRRCGKMGCRITGHSVDEKTLHGQMTCCAGVMPFYEYEDIPGIDWLGLYTGPEATPRQVSSVAMQLGKKQIITETYGGAGWDINPRQLTRIAHWQYVNGVNLMCQHLYPYSIRGQRKRDYPAFYSQHNPWTDESRIFNDYFSKIGYCLANSKEEANVLIIHPIHNAYLTYNRNDSENSVKWVNAPWIELIEKFGKAGIVHHYGDERIMERHGKVENGKLVIGKCSYDTVVLPTCKTLDHSTVPLLKRFLEEGGKLWVSSEMPYLIDGEPASLDFLESNTTFEEIRKNKALFYEPCDDIRCTLRRTEDGWFVYAVNLSETEEREVALILPSDNAVEYDFLTSEKKYLPQRKLRLGAGEGKFIFSAPEENAKREKSLTGRKITLPDTMYLTPKTENALTLDQAELSTDGINYEKAQNVMALSDLLLQRRKNGPVWLRYSFFSDFIPENLYLETETVENSEITVNGKTVIWDGHGVLDRSFVRANIAELTKIGKNEIVVRSEYRQSEQTYDVFNGFYYGSGEVTETLLNCVSYGTNIEALYLFGDFSIKAEKTERGNGNVIFGENFTVSEPKKEICVRNITEDGYFFFRGKMRLSTTVTLERNNYRLHLKGNFQYAKVFVNGKAAAAIMLSETLDLSDYLREGENEITLELMASNRNVFGVHHLASDPDPKWVGPMQFSLYGTWKNGKSAAFRDNYSFVRFGADEFLLEEYSE